MKAKKVENNEKTTAMIGGCTGKGFMPGRSGNPGGRPKSEFGEMIRTETNGGAELVERVINILRTSKDHKLVMDAATWLSDRGFGRPLPQSEGEDGSGRRVIEVVRYFSDEHGSKI